MKTRIGFGYDVHRLELSHDLIIGGVRITSNKGSVGHSDADVLIHAICDALLGAANLGDIGQHFPDTCSKYKNADSSMFLKNVNKLICKHKYKIVNIDSTICLQSPKLASYIPDMKKNLAHVLEIEESCISIKATTTENLGFVGKNKGISAYAVALICS